MRLDELSRNIPARVSGFCPCNADLETRLREIGFAEGDAVVSMHRGPVGGDPLAVKLGSTFIALRRSEARGVFVTTDSRSDD